MAIVGIRRSWFILIVVPLLLGSPGAFADHVEKGDADDSPSALDIAGGRHGHESTDTSQKLIAHSLAMYEDWDGQLLLSAEVYDISLHFDTNGDHDPPIRAIGFCGEGYERILEVRASEDGSLFASIRRAGGKIIGFVRVSRPDVRSVDLAFPRSVLGTHVKEYEWCAQTAYYEEDNPSEECGASNGVETLCTDRLPNKKAVVHDLR